MSTSTVDIGPALAQDVTVSDDTLTVNLTDGRTISVPLAWYPRLLHATSRERRKWRLIGKGQGIHWPDVEEDISVLGLLLGHPSCESRESFANWLAKRKAPPAGRSRPRRKPPR